MDPSTPLDNEDVKESSNEELSSLNDAPNTIIKLLIKYDKSLSKNKGHVMSKEPLKSHSPSISSMNALFSNISSSNDTNLRQKAIKYLSYYCLRKVKRLKKDSINLKPILIIKQPIFNVRSLIFTITCYLHYSKIVDSEGLFYMQPSKYLKYYHYINNNIPYKPIPALYKAEFAEL
ncbi:hypothetical protein EIK77_000944 [Talaromyces pinophilus]|nr:hypothetical protein EIK77_000944 [Talaromyces pinophilus]